MSYEPRPEFGARDGKKTSRIKKQLNRVVGIFVIIAASIAFYFLLLRATGLSDVIGKILDILEPILMGLIFAYILNPMANFAEGIAYRFLQKDPKNQKYVKSKARALGIVFAYLVAIAVLAAILGIVVPQLFTSIRDLAVSLPSQLNSFVVNFADRVSNNNLLAGWSDTLTDLVDQATDSFVTWLRQNLLQQTNALMSSVTAGVINFFGVLFNILIGMIVAIYVLMSKEQFAGQIKKSLYALMKPENANLVLHITRKSNDIFGGFIIGKIIDSAIIGVLCFVAMSVLNMPYTLLVSVIVGVTNVIPFFGPYIGGIPCCILIMLSDFRTGIYFIILILVIQQLDGNIIGPKIIGNSTGLSPFWVIFSILLGKGLFGFVGMLFGVPTFAVIYYIVSMIIDQKLYYKKLPMDSEVYNNAEYVDVKTHKLMYEQQKEPEDKVESTGEDKKEKGE
jgi:predicted PurR-regulated permease PerM